MFASKEGAIYLLKADLQFTPIGAMPGVSALAGIADGRVIAVSGKKVTVLHADGSPGATVDCSCQATIARPLGQSKFVLTDRDDGPMWLVDASGAELHVAFVPEAVNE